jgi:hypothetical protein
VIFGIGSGFGMGYNNCQVEFNSAFSGNSRVAACEDKKKAKKEGEEEMKK